MVEEFREACGPADPEVAKALYPDSLRALLGVQQVKVRSLTVIAVATLWLPCRLWHTLLFHLQEELLTRNPWLVLDHLQLLRWLKISVTTTAIHSVFTYCSRQQMLCIAPTYPKTACSSASTCSTSLHTVARGHETLWR